MEYHGIPLYLYVFVLYMIWVCLKMDETPWNAQNMPVKMRFLVWKTSLDDEPVNFHWDKNNTQQLKAQESASHFPIFCRCPMISHRFSLRKAPRPSWSFSCSCHVQGGLSSFDGSGCRSGAWKPHRAGFGLPLFQGPSEIPKVELMGIMYYYILYYNKS